MILDLSTDMSGKPTLTAEELNQDLDVLRHAALKGYAGPDFRPWLDRVPVSGQSSQSFCTDLAGVFDRVRNAHLRANLEFRNCGARLTPGQVGANISANGWVNKKYFHQGAWVDVLAIPAFWSKDDARWDGFLDQVRALRQNGRSFVIDMRGNVGGDDWMGFAMAAILLGAGEGDALPTPVATRRIRQTPEALAIGANYWGWHILRLRHLGKTVPVYMEQKRTEYISWIERAKNNQFPGEYLERLPRVDLDQTQFFRQKVVVIVDRLCASACETTLQVLETLPARVLVGENTMGAVQYGEVGRLVLPHSKVTVSLSTVTAHFRDGRRIERIGYAPAVRVAVGQDALVPALTESLK